jgi:two-component system chemotaxis response regulator CheY
MVVDDSLLTIKRVSALLTDLGHQIVGTAGTGAQAMSAYEDCQPDIVTMDITMPDMDGIDATRSIMGKHPEARIIMVTSHGQERMVVDALSAGAKGYVLKPIKPDKLADMISKVIDGGP